MNKLYLGRPWRGYSRTAFIRCQLPKQIAPEGWSNWGNSENEKTVSYAEYKNTGEGANTKSRVAWSKQLSDKEAKEFTPETIFSIPHSTIQQDSDWFQNIRTKPFQWPEKTK